ncbi:Crp/Fnr family transcriptional regulator [Uliginosibacterium sp. H1]|uniref:Crp/Fnr family transcriptional regulator n=1 Tax=Uliginosibacterium sp. H1 TaxID=3114757 RepID=UPI002E191088|nr:Crp/Fnr family transcriptional regulator [Uliginosibacterium sp. H1]
MRNEIDCRQCPLKAVKIFSSHTPEEAAFIQAFRKRELHVEAGGTVVREAASNDDLYTLRSGWAFRYRTLSDGRRQILNFLLPGDFTGLQQEVAGNTPYGVEALTDAELCVFPRSRLWDLYSRFPSLGYDLTWLSAHQELIVDENLVSVGRRTALERVAMLLVHLYKRSEVLGLVDQRGMHLPVTQQHIADALGLSLVHTNRTLRRLASAGLYELDNGHLRLGDLTRMQRIAEYNAIPVRGRPFL